MNVLVVIIFGSVQMVCDACVIGMCAGQQHVLGIGIWQP